MRFCNFKCTLPEFGRDEFIVDLFADLLNIVYSMPTNKISGCILELLDYFFLFGTRHSESNIGYNEARDICLGEEPTLIHASSKEVES